MNIEMIWKLIGKFRKLEFFSIDEFGKNPEIITTGITKYEPVDNNFTQVTVFERDEKVAEIGFLTPPIKDLVSYFIHEFGEPNIFYNFRDEFTRLEFYTDIDWIDKLSCDVDGHWEKNNTKITNLESGEVIEDISLNGFFIQLK